MEITDSDLKRVEQLFFPEGGSFEDPKNERYEFIKCIDRSIDVQACPGSGKTTSLLAKLYLLSEKMPFDDGRGICVLTHTNVAIDLIKDKLGPRADILFRHPNFFGTIQSFVNRYLAIPYYIKKTGKRPNQIDTEAQKRKMETTYVLNNVERDELKKLKHYHYSRGLFGSYSCKKKGDEFIVYNSYDGKEVEFRKPKSKIDWPYRQKKRLKEIAAKLKFKVMAGNGTLSYDDAFEFALSYLEKSDKVRSLFEKRFKYLFIDEMQDTYERQLEILDRIFRKNVIIQRIGDSNQAILGDDTSKSAWKKSEDLLHISDSIRYSPSIAKVLRCVAIDPEPNLTGRNDSQIPCHIITYQQDSIHLVIEKFVEIVKSCSLDERAEREGNPIKAIGWIGKSKEKLTIGDYYKHYFKSINKKRRSFPNLITLLACSRDATPKEFKDNIFNGLIEILSLSKTYHEAGLSRRPFTKSTLQNFVVEYDEFLWNELLAKISSWYLKRHGDIHSEIESYLLDEFFPKLNIKPLKKAFISSKNIEDTSSGEAVKTNIYQSDNSELNHIKVPVGTVHSVKGETHTATLYLETYYQRKTCGEYLMEQLCGKPYDGKSKKGNTYKDRCMKVAHVGFSRPTDLLCVAINKDLVDNNRTELEEFGWKIIDL